jgi:hypothetical protein
LRPMFGPKGSSLSGLRPARPNFNPPPRTVSSRRLSEYLPCQNHQASGSIYADHPDRQRVILPRPGAMLCSVLSRYGSRSRRSQPRRQADPARCSSPAMRVLSQPTARSQRDHGGRFGGVKGSHPPHQVRSRSPRVPSQLSRLPPVPRRNWPPCPWSSPPR